MRRLTVTLAVLAASAATGIGCGSDTGDGSTQGLTGGTVGKGGGASKGGTGSSASGGTGSTGGTGSSAGGSIHVSGGTSGTNGGASGSTSGSSGSFASGGACTGTTATGQKGAGAVVLFLVDTSLSMNMNAGMTTRIAATKSALTQSFGTLDAGLNVGLLFYPDVAANAMPCFDSTIEVPIGVLSAAQVGLLNTSVNGARAGGSTPTHDAYALAVQTIKASTAVGDKYIVLITDGAPSYSLGCMGTGLPDQDPPIPTAPLIAAAEAAFTADGIKTFVVGSPGSDPARDSLSAMARVGGTGQPGCADTGPNYCHFDMTQTANFGASLAMALGQIQQQIPVDCSFDLPRPPTGMTLNLDMINVTVTNDDMTKTQVGRDPAGDCATDGWTYVGNPPTSVQLCGALCETVKAQASPSIDVQFGCSQRVNPPK